MYNLISIFPQQLVNVQGKWKPCIEDGKLLSAEFLLRWSRTPPPQALATFEIYEVYKVDIS